MNCTEAALCNCMAFSYLSVVLGRFKEDEEEEEKEQREDRKNRSFHVRV